MSSFPAWWPTGNESIQLTPSLWAELKSALDVQKYVPCRASDIVSKELIDRSGRHYIIKNGKTHTYMRLAPEEFWLWSQMDGEKTVQKLVIAYFMEYKAFAFGAIVSLIERLRASYMLTEVPGSLYADLTAGMQAQSLFYKLTLGARAAFTREFTIRNLDKHLDNIHRQWGWILFTIPAQIIYFILSTVGLYLFFVLSFESSYKILSFQSPLQFGILAYLPLLIHEFGHAITAKHYGCEVYKGGVMLYYGLPAAFVDTTDVWMFGKRARLAVTWAGPYTGYIIGGGLAMIVYFAPNLSLQTSVSLLQVASAAIFTTTLNILPLLKLDGYYLLSDALEIPRLRERSMEFLTRNARDKFIKREKWTREEKIFLIFGVLAFLSTFYFTWEGLHFWDRQASTSISELLRLEGDWTTLLWNIFIGALAVSFILLSISWLASHFRTALHWLQARGLLSTSVRSAFLIVLAAIAFTLIPPMLLPSSVVALSPLSGVLGFGFSAWLFFATFLSMRGSIHRWMWLTAGLGTLMATASFPSSLNPAWWNFSFSLKALALALSLLSVGMAGRLITGLRGAWRFLSIILYICGICFFALSLFVSIPSFDLSIFAGFLTLGAALHWRMRPPTQVEASPEIPIKQSARARLISACNEIRVTILSELALDFGSVNRERVERGVYRPRSGKTIGAVEFDESIIGMSPADYGVTLAISLDELLVDVESVGGQKYAWRALAHGFDKLDWELQEVAEDSLLKYVRHAKGLSNVLSSQRNDLNILLRSVPLFANLTDENLAVLERKFTAQHFGRGDDIVRAGDSGDSFFVISAGRAEVLSVNGERLTTLGRGDYFGEAALLTGAKRNATIRALTPLQAMALNKRHFDRILRNNVNFDEASRNEFHYLSVLRQIPLFEHFEGHDLKMLATKLEKIEVSQGKIIFEQGSLDNCFYVLETGKVSVQIDGQERAILGTGEYFGEMALMSDAPRTATVIAIQPTVLLRLAGRDFQELTQHADGIKQAIERVASRRKLINRRAATESAG